MAAISESLPRHHEFPMETHTFTGGFDRWTIAVSRDRMQFLSFQFRNLDNFGDNFLAGRLMATSFSENG